jgi:molybdopterin/thiamine biosynthesis adenylyltransferase/nitroreductase
MTYQQLRALELRRPARERLRVPRILRTPLDPDEVLRPTPETEDWWPQGFPAGDPRWRARLAARVAEGGFTVHDSLADQLAELVETRAPAEDLGPEALRARVAAHLGGTPIAHHGTWFLYPWSRRVVHVLPEHEFRELRSSRNRNKISTEEQERLRALRIGVVGLSVGSASAVALAMEQVGGELFLADFDRLSLSNMNRLRAGVHDIGVRKAHLTARIISELDPYVKVHPVVEGITDENMDAFLCPGGRPLDLLVEECDDLYVKVRIRERARALRIPVVMETSDRGLLDVERFDLEPDRPIFHGLTGPLDAAKLRGLDSYEKVPIVLRIIGERTVSPRLAASLVEVKSSLRTWPQLASAVSLGAAAVTDTARRIALGQLTASGRFFVDLEEIVRDGAGAVEPVPADADAGAEPVDEARSAPATPPVAPAAARGSATPGLEQVRALVRFATLAPSGGNCQPWRFRWDGRRLRLLHDLPRSESFLDYGDLASWLAFGAAAENVALVAGRMGLDVEVELGPDAGEPAAVCDLRFRARRASAASEDAGLAAAIPERVTNRRLSPRVALDRDDRGALLRAAADVPGGALHLVEDADRLAELGEVLGRGDRLRFLSRTMHREMMQELRWSADSVRATRDGLDVATLELTPTDLAGLRVMSSWPAMDLVGRIGGGRALEKPARKAIAAASAVGLVTVPGRTREAYFAGGRAMQRVWLEATARGLAFQPMAPLTYLFARLELGGGEGLAPGEVMALRELRTRFATLFPAAAGLGEPMLFRLSRAAPPTARALRRPVEDVLEVEGG